MEDYFIVHQNMDFNKKNDAIAKNTIKHIEKSIKSTKISAVAVFAELGKLPMVNQTELK